jgi:hypothetical protein
MDKIFVYAKLSGFAPRENGQLPSTAEYAVKGFQRALRTRLEKRYEIHSVEVQHVDDNSQEEISALVINRKQEPQEHEEMVQYVKDCIKEVYDDHRFWKQGILAEIDDAFEDCYITSPIGRFQNIDRFLMRVRAISRHAENAELMTALEELQSSLYKVYDIVGEKNDN